MGKQVFVVTFCDWPGCTDPSKRKIADAQETTTSSITFYVHGRGRPPAPVRVELCEAHISEMRDLMTHLTRFNQKDTRETDA